VLDAGGFDNAPRIVAIEGNRVLSGSSDTIYTTEVKEQHKLWQIFRPGKALVDPKPATHSASKRFSSAMRARPGWRAGQFPDRHLAHGNPDVTTA
jgi:hypothetical protein